MNLFYDGFNSLLIEDAPLESFLEIPQLNSHNQFLIPRVGIPFSKRKRLTNPQEEMLVFYEHDHLFRNFVSTPQKFDQELRHIQIISTPDCSLYRDMPLWEQVTNICMSRSIGYYLQKQLKYVIPNVRWGDSRTYTTQHFGFIPAFAGIPKNDIVSIGTYGCSKTKEDKYFLEAGLQAMLECLTPQHVLVYGCYRKSIFNQYEKYTQFHHLPDWTTYIHNKHKGAL